MKYQTWYYDKNGIATMNSELHSLPLAANDLAIIKNDGFIAWLQIV